MKTSELTGAALDWAVTKCEGHEAFYTEAKGQLFVWKKCSLTGDNEVTEFYQPSTDWSQGGPIIERERINIRPNPRIAVSKAFVVLPTHGLCHVQDGPTPLIAAMRCYVASKLGDEINIPKELM